ncbi:hypothetical protein QFC22_004277 [Naganishia vaughanmartiniae]|uniref:Uncharacterized protein n=1 Tax=Naganishia vaughanmartiniae TaxID=1424756 RepID=A0ACC2X0Q2_9TREE|nr:hypothetical protein QFC22_004277 [Naganishia vaughanmartiniae]
MPPPTASLKPSPAAGAAVAAASNKTEKSTASNKLGKPDQSAYHQEQDDLNKEIDNVKAQLNDVRAKLALLHAPQSETDRRSVIKAELDQLQAQQRDAKGDRNKLFDQMKRLQDGISNKIKDVNSQKSKLPVKNRDEAEQRITHLDKQIESGTLKLIDEKKSLNEISLLRRSLTSLTKLTTLEESIASDRAQVDELKKTLDDPESKRVQARWDELKAEMDGLREEGRKAWDERNGLFEKRNELQKQMDDLYTKKKEANQKNRDAQDAYYAKIREDQKAKQDRFRAQKAAEESVRREEEITRMREDAKIPAFEREIEDCGVLIGWFNGKFGNKVPETHAGNAASAADEARVLEGVKELNLRKVEDAPVGSVLKKNADEQDPWASLAGTGGKKGKKGGKKSAAPAAVNGSAANGETSTPPTPSANPSAPINLPFALLTAILNLSIPPPANAADVHRCIADLEHKKAWFEANQKKKTEEEVQRVEALIKKMQKKAGESKSAQDAEVTEATLVEGVKEVDGRKEPFHTAAPSANKDPVAQGEQLPTTPEVAEEPVQVLDVKLEQAKEEIS